MRRLPCSITSEVDKGQLADSARLRLHHWLHPMQHANVDLMVYFVSHKQYTAAAGAGP
jgi:hypothetical protein